MRYERQEAFRHIGKRQKLLEKSKVVIVGCGGLGSNSAEMLARAGVGKIEIIDKDKVELSNLQRVSLFSERDIGKDKAEAAKAILANINSDVKVIAHVAELDESNKGLLNANIVLDCTDNIESRYLINGYCRKHKINWVHAAVLGAKGMVISFLPERGFCYRCIFSDAEVSETTATAGILNTTVKAIASLQVSEALKILTGQEASKELICLDLWKMELEKVNLKADKKCEVCKNC